MSVDFTLNGHPASMASPPEIPLLWAVHSLARDYVHRYHIYDPFRSRCTPATIRSVELQGLAPKQTARAAPVRKATLPILIASKVG
jgi:hypothetical protein